ncbi:MAG: allantoicase [Alphaproteobacteria bacterium]
MTDIPEFARQYVNLASARLGAVAVCASDEFFADKQRMLADAAPVFIDDKYDDHGKWMDGWETRRRRGLGNDWCLVKLGMAGILRGVDIDTAHFTGNFPPAASVEACMSEAEPSEGADWRLVAGPASLGPDAQHFIPVEVGAPVNWLRLNIFPDGGVARLRAYGEPWCDWRARKAGDEFELSALAGGGRIVGFNDAHYGNVWSLLTAGRGRDMGDGWETRRRREPGHDWIVIALGAPGSVTRIEIDTAHYKGNFPDQCSLLGANVTAGTDASIITQSMFWDELMAQKPLQADHIHQFTGDDLADLGAITHVRLAIFPDGGISRLRIFGKLE